MKYQLIKPVNSSYSIVEQVLTNRGIPYEEINHYLSTTDKDINSYESFGMDKLEAAATALISCVKNNQDALVVVDCDCDGYTSSAVLINYLHDLFPNWVETNLDFVMHEGKQHGLSDHIENITNVNYQLILVPDAGSNDAEECRILKEEYKMDVVVLDHHLCDIDNPYAIVINNQLSNYPNKELSGVGVVWQFCRYLDNLLGVDFANNYLDLVALGLDGDMMSLTSIETKHLIRKGLTQEKNPFITYMHERNHFSIGDELTPINVAFYIVPYVNAITRSGTIEEKELIFNSMLRYKAFQEVPSTKRGHKAGDTEKIVEQAVRVASNVKARQTKAQDAGMELLNNMIEEYNMLDHQVLVFLLKPGQVDKNIAGLVANKLMAKYQKPVCVLTKQKEQEVDAETGKVLRETSSYHGSARGCDKTGITDFKSICDNTGVTLYTAGHPGAFGVGVEAKDIEVFIERIDEQLKDAPNEPIYFVDYIYNFNNLNPQDVLDIAYMSHLWGMHMDESLVAIEGLKVSAEMVTIYSKKSLAIKIELPLGINLMMFNASEYDCELLQTNNSGFIEINCVCKCNANEWNGMVTPQFFCEEYEVVDSNRYFF